MITGMNMISRSRFIRLLNCSGQIQSRSRSGARPMYPTPSLEPTKRGARFTQFNPQNSPNYLYLFEEKPIKAVTQHLLHGNESTKDYPIVDYHPGPGFLIRNLLREGAPHVFYRESDFESAPVETWGVYDWPVEKDQLLKEFPDRVSLMSSFFDENNDPSSPGSLVSKFKLYASPSPIYESRFTSSLIHRTLTRSYLFQSGPVPTYMFLSSFEFRIVNSQFKDQDYFSYRSKAALFQSVFNIKHIDTIKWDSFHPKIRINPPSKKNVSPNQPQTQVLDSDHSVGT